MGTDGFEFVELRIPRPEALHALFRLMGYAPVARHKTKAITVYRQGDINYLVNEAARRPRPQLSSPRTGRARRRWRFAWSMPSSPTSARCRSAPSPRIFPRRRRRWDVPAIKGIGGSLLYFIEHRYGAKGSAYDAEFEWLGAAEPAAGGRRAVLSITSPTTSFAAR